MTEYEKDLNELKEHILKERDTLVTKRALLERFCKIDEEYNGEPWNLLQILTNINILIGAESCEDAVSRSSVFEIMGNLMSIPYDLDRPINKKDVSDSMGEIRALPPVKPTRKKGKWIKSNIGGAKVCSICQAHMGLSNFNYCPNCGAKMGSKEE